MACSVRGVVSIAENGHPRTMTSPAESKGRLEQFIVVKFPIQPAFRLLEPATLKVSIDLVNAGEGLQAVAVKGNGVPENLSLYRIDRNVIHLDLRRVTASTQ